MSPQPVFAAASRLSVGDHHVSGLGWSSDGRYLAVASTAPALSIWEVEQPDHVVDIPLPAPGVAGPFWGPQTDKIALLLADGSVGLWSHATGERLEVACDSLAQVAGARWSPDGYALAAVSSGRIGLWESYRGGPKRVLQGGPRAEALEWSPDSATLAAGGGRTVLLWNTRTGGQRRKLEGAPGRVLSIAWSPDAGTLAAAGSDDAHIRIWSTQTGSIVKLLPTGAAAAVAVGFSRCGNWLGCKDSDGRLRLWSTADWHEEEPIVESPAAAVGTPLLAFSPAVPRVASYDPAHAEVTVYAIQEPGKAPVVVTPAVPTPTPRKVFISYARKDRTQLDRLLEFLAPLKQEYELEIWSDRAIDAGTPWHAEIQDRLQWADLIIFLVSPPLFDSKYIRNVEWQIAMQRHEARAATIVPVIVRHADWEYTAIGALQALPDNGKPISGWHDKDKAFRNVADGLRRLIAKPRQ